MTKPKRKKASQKRRPRAVEHRLAKRRESEIARERREERERARSRRSFRAGWQVGKRRKGKSRDKAVGLVSYYARATELKVEKRNPGSYIRSFTLEFPKVFSFIENPEGALDFFEDFVRKALARPKKMHFDQSKSDAVDFCALSLLNALGGDLRNERKVKFEGYLPHNPEIQDIVLATGLPQAIGLEYESTISTFRRHELRRGRKGLSGSSTSDRNRETTSVVDYVNACIGDLDHELTAEGQEYLAALVGEVIDNAERHSGQDDWWIAGYLRRQRSDAADFHLVIFNLGRTIAQTLQDLPPQSALRDNIRALLKAHKPRWFRPKWTEENLWTLYAMQEGVSRKNRGTTKTKDFGQGTVDMVRYFQELADPEARGSAPVMVLVSGRTYIRFDERYTMKPEDAADPKSYQVIAFNDKNTLWEPPNETAVRNLSKFFPGTLLSLRFVLTKDHLEEVSE